jgi:hypothetical protein
MRQTQTELLRFVNSRVEMYVNAAGFYHREIESGAIKAALARLKGKAHRTAVIDETALVLDLPPEVLNVPDKDGYRTTWERECTIVYSDYLVEGGERCPEGRGVCLPFEMINGKGYWQFKPNIAPETPDYSEIK